MMNIRNEVSEKTTFEDIELEDVFMYGNKIYMKVARNKDIDDGESNAYDFTGHTLTNFIPDAKVELYRSELVIYGKDAKM